MLAIVAVFCNALFKIKDIFKILFIVDAGQENGIKCFTPWAVRKRATGEKLVRIRLEQFF